MCGIVGYIGTRRAAPVLLEGLKKLEYRGYDSAGIATLSEGDFYLIKRKGRVETLGGGEAINGTTGIGHTRWATHGVPSAENAHPHIYGRFAIVHNGIIENARALKNECLARGEIFSSETDSEVIAHLLDRYYKGDLLACLYETAKRLEGSYALAVLEKDEPDTIACARYKSPLVVGRTAEGETLLASDIPAIAQEGAELTTLSDGDFALLKRGEIQLFNKDLRAVTRPSFICDAQTETPDKNGYLHFMRKEIDEIPFAMRSSAPIIDGNSEYSELYRVLCQTEYIEIIACGTAYHSGLCAAHAFESVCRVPCRVSLASEYRYRDPIVKKGMLAIAVSQSGETADTIAAAQIAKERGAFLVALTNAPYSTLTTFSDVTMVTGAGREVAVAATKSFNAQLMTLYSMVRALALHQGKKAECRNLPALAGLTIEESKKVQSWVSHFVGAKSVFFLGRGADRYAAQEGSLKLKEISYIPSEGYAAGELKHGTLALVDSSTPIVALLTQKAVAEKTMNAVHEVAARGAKVFLVTAFDEYCAREEVYASLVIPACEEAFSPALSVIPLQMLAYYVSLACGNDPDKPRNLAKSVTVE